MFDWRVGLRNCEGKWFSTAIDTHGSPVLSANFGYDTVGKSVDQLQKELEEWDSYKRARFPL